MHTVLKVRLPTENLQVRLFGILNVRLLDGFTSTTYIILLLVFIITRSNLSFNSFNSISEIYHNIRSNYNKIQIKDG